jgi:CO/xanthine dehydrogenase FAD-binding subunit
MQGTISNRRLFQPRTMRDALAMLHDEGPLEPLAGCTDLYVALNFGSLGSTRFIDLMRLDPLRGIEVRTRSLWIGALSTHSELIRSPLVRRRLPMLAAACREIGGVQIQNRGTLGGNVANASPAGDTLPVLAVADATVVLRGAAGTRRVPFTSFYTGYRQTARRADELIVGFDVPLNGGRQWFRKVGTRAAQAISKVVIAGAITRDGEVRLAAGSVAPTVVRLAATEAAIAGRASAETIERAVTSDITPIDDVRSTAEYRSRVAANLVRRFCIETKPQVK